MGGQQSSNKHGNRIEELASNVVIESIPTLSLQALLDEDKESKKRFASLLERDGFICLNLYGTEYVAALQNIRNSMHKFFALNAKTKQKYVEDGEEDIGYNEWKKQKEAFQIRLSSTHFPWPSEIPALETDGITYYKLMDKLTRLSLSILSEALECDSSAFWKVLDEPIELLMNSNKEEDWISRSLLRLIHYYNSERENPDAYMDHHADISLITFIPISETPGLQVMKQNKNEWLDIENGIVDPSNHLIMIGGEILQFMSNKKYRACVHRVIPLKSNRLSIPYLVIPLKDIPINPIEK